MTCVTFCNVIVCTSPWGRLKLGNRYIYLDYHEYCGPSFSWDRDGAKPYIPTETDPIWPLFSAWLEKYEAKKLKGKK